MPIINYDDLGFVFVEEDMFNPQYKMQFISNKYPNYSKESLPAAVNMFKKIGAVERLKDKDVVFFSEQDFVDLFKINNWFDLRAVETSKTAIREYMRWYMLNQKENWSKCNIRDTIDKIFYENLPISNRYSKEFFLSVSELQSEIDMVYKFIAPRNIDYGEFNISTAALYLAWYRVTCQEAVEIKKDDVSRDENTIKLNDRTIELDQVSMDFIRKYANSPGYPAATRGGIISKDYVQSDYLFRSSELEQLSVNLIRSNLSKFASKPYRVDGLGKKFKYDSVRFSGIYYKLIKYEEEREIKLTRKDIAIFEKYFDEDYSDGTQINKFYVRFRNFERYRQYFYNIDSD